MFHGRVWCATAELGMLQHKCEFGVYYGRWYGIFVCLINFFTVTIVFLKGNTARIRLVHIYAFLLNRFTILRCSGYARNVILSLIYFHILKKRS